MDRSLCLTAGAGEAAAWSCGDLVLTHSMPGYATLGRERSLTLIHNSATSYPRPPIAASVTMPATIAKPDSVFAQLTVGGTIRASASYGGWPSGTSGTRQIVLDFDASGYTTGAYPLELLVQNRYAGAVQGILVKDTLLIVNRFFSEYGAGFSLAGVEQLHLDQPVGTGLHHIVWVGGDGSAKLYRQVDSTTWVAPAGAYRDMLTWNGNTYTRTLRHGIQVTFNSAGRHIATVNRAGQQTTFTWNPAGNRLVSIGVPPRGVTGTTYTLAWDGNGNLDYVQDPAGRKLDATFNFNDGRLNTLTDPDEHAVGFGWDGDRRIISRRSRRGFTTTYEYSLGRTVGSRVSKVTVPVGRTVGDNATAVSTFASWNDQGLATGASGQSAVPVSQAYTKIFGPRYPTHPDTAAFTVDRWGAPTKIVNALGATTRLSRGDPWVPALVTKLTGPDGRIDSMAYDRRGNLLELQTITSGVIGSTPLPTATTRWMYDSLYKDSPDSIIDPEGVVTRYAYDSLGLTSRVTAANGHVTQYITVPRDSLKGLLQAVQELSVPAWDSTRQEILATLHTGFAFNTLGNVVADTSPLGRVRRYPRDAKQRVDNFYDAAGHRTSYAYDDLNRTLQVVQHVELDGSPGFPRDSGFTAPLTSAWQYDTDVLSFAVDPRQVPRRYEYDRAGRAIRELDDYTHPAFRWFDAAGLLDSVQSRLGSVVRHTYDAAGRLIKTAWPAGTGAAADSVMYSYDNVNRLTQATTAGGIVTRTYYGTGALRTEVLSSTTPLLTVTQAYYYDKAGRRIGYRTGTTGDPTHSDSVSYFYDAAGDLTKMLVKWRTVGGVTVPDDSVRFRWDALGRRDSVVYSNGMTIGFAYDRDGAQRLICTTAGVSNPASNDISQFRVVHDWIDVDGMIRKVNANLPVPAGCTPVNGLAAYAPANTYDNRHQLKSSSDGPHSSSYTYDGSGNLTQTLTDGVIFIDSMGPNHNRLVKRAQTGGVYKFYDYNDDGSRFSENTCPSTFACQPNVGYRRYLYDGLNRMSGTMDWACSGSLCQVTPTTNCRYDPMSRLIRPCENVAPQLAYDGPNVLRTGSDNSTGSDWTFIHGPGVDDPLLGRYSGSTKVAFFVTDGQGRQLAVVARDGTDFSAAPEYTQQGGKYAGGTSSGSSFGADRFASANVPGVSFFRNRVYDQTTGRWTQEDPIGLAGGLNLYQFNGNNPALLIDPFGLCPKDVGGDGETASYNDCPPGTEGYRTYLESRGTVGGSKRQTDKKSEQAQQALPEARDRLACVVGGFTIGAIRGAGRGLIIGALQGLRRSGPIALTNAARVGVIAGALSVEAGGSAAVPAFLGTYATTTLSVVATDALTGAAVGIFTGGTFGAAAAYKFDLCPAPLH